MPTTSTQTTILPTILCDDNDAITWEHLEDVSTVRPKKEYEAKKEQQDPENEPRAYHVENVADVESHSQSNATNASFPPPPEIRITPCFENDGERLVDGNVR